MKGKFLFVLFVIISVFITKGQTFTQNSIYYTVTNGYSVQITGGFLTGNVILPENVLYEGTIYSVTSIKTSAFNNSSSVTGLTIPSSITSIGNWAFSNCNNLITVDNQSNITSIGDGVFYMCINLVSATVPSTLTSIGNYSFEGCRKLKEITIPASVTTIGSRAFYNCFDLNAIYCRSQMPVNLASSSYVFYGVNKSTSIVYVPKGSYNSYKVANQWSEFSNIEETLFIGDTFIDNGINYKITSSSTVEITAGGNYTGSINIPISVTKSGVVLSVTAIGVSAFLNCTNLVSVALPRSILSIGSRAFSNCTSLTGVSIPTSLKSIPDYAFSGCTSLVSFQIPESISLLGQYVFSTCTALISITLPSRLSSIGTETFRDCSSLTSIYCNMSSPSNLGGWVFLNVNKNDCKIYVPAGSLNQYQSALQWGDFLQILETDVINNENLLANGGFESDPTIYSVNNELWRLNDFQDNVTQATYPTMTPADVSAGKVWLKKHVENVNFNISLSGINVHSGTKCLSLHISEGAVQAGMDNWSNMTCLQGVNLSNTKTYKATVWARVNETTPNTCNVITLFVTDKTLKANYSIPIELTGGATWTKYEINFDLPDFVSINPTADFTTAFFGVGIYTTYNESANTNYSGVLLDDIALEEIISSTSYFRTNSSGNWNEISTWQSSLDNATWGAATSIPTQAATAVNVRNGHTITVVAPTAASVLIVDAGAKLTLNSGQTLTTDAFTINSNMIHGTGTFVDKGGMLTIYSNSNLLQNSGFELTPSSYTIMDELWRVDAIQDISTQTSYPVMTSTDISSGGVWLKKHTNAEFVKVKSSSAYRKSGNYSINMYIPDNTPANMNSNIWSNQLVFQRITTPLSNTKKYKVSVWARVDNTVGNVCDRITFFITDNTKKTYYSSTVILTEGITWKQYEAVFDIPVFVISNPTADFSTAFLGIGIESTLQDNNSELYNYSGVVLDDINLTEMTNSANVNQFLNLARNWYISSPVTNATAQTGYTYFKYREAGDNVAYVSPATAYWESVNSGSTLFPGQGYIANLATDNSTINFSGILNTGIQSVTLNRSNSVKPGFNLVGNPYPSYLDVSDLQSNTDLESTYWVRSFNVGYVFDTYNIPGGIATNLSGKTLTSNIAPMQAFWLRVKEGSSSANVLFTNAMRVHQDVENNKFRTPNASNSNKQILRLQISNGVKIDETVLYTHPNASNLHDSYDSEKMSNNSVSTPEIYTIVGNAQLVINGFKSIPYNSDIPLGFKTGEKNTLSLKLSEFSNFEPETQVILKDYQDSTTETEYNLTDGNSYVFTTDATTTNDRFKIFIKVPTQTTANQMLPNSVSTDFNVFKTAENKIIVNYYGEKDSKTMVSVFNALGQQIEIKELINSAVIFDNDYENGVYTIQLKSGSKKISKKIIII